MKSRKWILCGAAILSITLGGTSLHAGRTLYVVNGFSSTLSKVDLENGVVSDHIVALGDLPNDIVIMSDVAYVVNSGSADLTVIDLTTDSVTDVIDLGTGNNPWSAAFYGDGLLYVTNFETGSVSAVDLDSGSVVGSIGVGTAPEGLLAVGDRLYVANSGYTSGGYEPGTVSVIDLGADTLVATVSVGINPQDLVVDPQGEINVVCTGDYWSTWGSVYCIDPLTLTVTDSISTGGTPGRAAISNTGLIYTAAGGWVDAGEVYLTNSLTNVVMHDSGDPLTTGTGATDIVIDGEGYVYVACLTANTVSVFDLPDEPVEEITVGSGPTAMAVYEDPWIEVTATPEKRLVHRGETLDYSVDIEHVGAEPASVIASSYLILPGGVPFAGNPIHGPFSLSLDPGELLSIDLTGVIPDPAPEGRYVFFTSVRDADSRKRTVGSFWFQVIP